MLNVSVRISGDQELESKLIKLGPQLTNFTSAMTTIGKELKSYYSGQSFASQGGAIGVKWRPLSPRYRLYKAKLYPGRGTNIRTGLTQRSFYYDANSKQVTVGNTSGVFDYLQLGTNRMPARPMLGVNENIRDLIGHIVELDIQQKLDKAGL